MLPLVLLTAALAAGDNGSGAPPEVMTRTVQASRPVLWVGMTRKEVNRVLGERPAWSFGGVLSETALYRNAKMLVNFGADGTVTSFSPLKPIEP